MSLASHDHHMLQHQLRSLLATMRQELLRLEARHHAVVRCRRSVEATVAMTESVDEDSIDELYAHIDAVAYDLSTFKTQLQERLQHLQSGERLASETGHNTMPAVLSYVLEGARLCARDAAVAREGYDELINSLHEMAHMNDQ